MFRAKNLSSLSSNGTNNSLQSSNNNNDQMTFNTRRYPSSTSLHYDHTSTPQSINNHHQHYRSISSMNHSKSLMRMNSGSNLKSMKRWSASQDIRFQSIDPNIKYVLSRLILLLCLPFFSHSIRSNQKDFFYNQGIQFLQIIYFDLLILKFLSTHTQ